MIIHKTMRMPTSCTMCWLSDTCEVWSNERNKHHGYDKRLEDCPLEEVKTGTPTVDAVPVVRCKDCKHYNSTPINMGYCFDVWGLYVEENDYCSRAERGEE